MSAAIPSGWREVPLRELAIIDREVIEANLIPTGALYVGLENVTSDGSFDDVRPVANGEIASAKFAFEPGHVLYGKLRPYLKKIARPTFKGVCSTDILPLKPKPKIADGAYLYHYLRQQRLVDLATARCAGANLPRLSPKVLNEFPVVVPPNVAEQRRIAAILDKADAIRRKRRQALAETDTLLRSVFLDMFGDPVTNPKGLPKQALRDLIQVKSGAFLPARDMDQMGVYAVYGGNGINGRHSAYMFKDPKIVIGRVGVYCGAVHVSEPCSWVTDNALYVSKMRSDIEFDYLAWALCFANLNQYTSQAAQPLISGSRIYPVDVLVPTPEAQRDFSRALGRIVELSGGLSCQVDSSESLFQSLSQRAFRGEL